MPSFKYVDPDDQVDIRDGMKFSVVQKDGLLPDGRLQPHRALNGSVEEWNAYVQMHLNRALSQHDKTSVQIRQELLRMFALPDAMKEKSKAEQQDYMAKVHKMIDMQVASSEQMRVLKRQDQFIARFTDVIRNMKPVLQPNEVSRIHKMQEGKVFKRGTDMDAFISFEHTFVVRHDWLAVLGDTNPELSEWELPFDDCVFEYKVDGHICLVHVSPKKDFAFFIEVFPGQWFFPDQDLPILDYLKAQVAAACVVIEAQVATHEVVRQPTALQAKRKKNGKPLLLDYHVIDLSKKRPRIANPTGNEVPEELKGRKRLHFCRGHWRHYATHRTRIPWCLKGNAELGFVDKMYKL